MKKICEYLKMEFDYVIIDCPAGIEQGFKNAIAGADRALVVTTPEVSAVRDADRIVGLLESSSLPKPELVLNRIRTKMVQRGEMMDADDIVELLSILNLYQVKLTWKQLEELWEKKLKLLFLVEKKVFGKKSKRLFQNKQGL